MFSKIKIYPLIIFICTCFSGCVRQVEQTNQSLKVDLFKESFFKQDAPENATLLPDSAYKYCVLSGIATQIKMIDSAANQPCFLYSAYVKSTDKGSAKKQKGKIYFIAYNRLFPVTEHSDYRFYFVPIINNNIVKKNLRVVWQWCPRAPLKMLPQ